MTINRPAIALMAATVSTKFLRTELKNRLTPKWMKSLYYTELRRRRLK